MSMSNNIRAGMQHEISCGIAESSFEETVKLIEVHPAVLESIVEIMNITVKHNYIRV
jgi:hypothetical protein